MEAAHVVCAPCGGIVWGGPRLLVKAPSGRQRGKVFAALHAITPEGLTVPHLTDMTAEPGCEVWRLFATAQPDIAVTVILDNARDQRCALVPSVAHTLGSEWLSFPTSSPNVNVLERFWKLVKTPCLYSTYDPDRESCQNAIMAGIEPAPILHNEALERL
jgi:hypothetical protein